MPPRNVIVERQIADLEELDSVRREREKWYRRAIRDSVFYGNDGPPPGAPPIYREPQEQPQPAAEEPDSYTLPNDQVQD